MKKVLLISVGIFLMAFAGGWKFGLLTGIAIAGLWIFIIGCAVDMED